MTFFKYNPKNFPFSSQILKLFCHLPQKQSLSSKFWRFLHGFYKFLMYLWKGAGTSWLIYHTNTILTYKIYFRHFHFPVRCTDVYRHKKALQVSKASVNIDMYNCTYWNICIRKHQCTYEVCMYASICMYHYICTRMYARTSMYASKYEI